MYFSAHCVFFALNPFAFEKGKQEKFMFLCYVYSLTVSLLCMCLCMSWLNWMESVGSCAWNSTHTAIQYEPLYVGSWFLPKCCCQRATIVHLYDTQYNPIHGLFCKPSQSPFLHTEPTLCQTLSLAFSSSLRFGLRGFTCCRSESEAKMSRREKTKGFQTKTGKTIQQWETHSHDNWIAIKSLWHRCKSFCHQ